MEESPLFPLKDISGTPPENPNITFTDSVPLYLNHLKANKKANTVATFGYILNSFGAYLKERNSSESPLRNITVDTLNAYVGFVRSDDKEYREKTVQNFIVALKNFFKWAAEMKYLEKSPADFLLYQYAERDVPPVLRLDQYEKVRQVASDFPDLDCLLLLFAEGGLKISEVLQLRKEDIDFDSRLFVRVSVRHSSLSKARTVTLDRSFQKPFSLLHPPEEGRIFPHERLWINRKLHSLKALFYARHNLLLGSKLTPTNLRHFCAYRLLLSGKTVPEIHSYLGLPSPEKFGDNLYEALKRAYIPQ